MADHDATHDSSTEFTSDELTDAVSSAKGVKSPVLSNNTTAKQAVDGRWFVQFSTSHSYGQSNGLDALKTLDETFTLTYTPHGATQWAAQAAEGMSQSDAEAFVEAGAEYVNVRGYHVRITEVTNTGRIKAEYPSSHFGDSRGEPKVDQLVSQLTGGHASPLVDDESDDDSETELVTDGGVETESASDDSETDSPQTTDDPFPLTSGFVSASEIRRVALDVEADAEIVVEYEHTQGSDKRVEGTVTYVVADESETVVEFARADDNHTMWITDAGEIHTANSHYSKQGRVTSVTVTTENSVDLPEPLTGVDAAVHRALQEQGSVGSRVIAAIDFLNEQGAPLAGYRATARQLAERDDEVRAFFAETSDDDESATESIIGLFESAHAERDDSDEDGDE